MRGLHPHERPLVDALFKAAGLARADDTVRVQPMQDGAMGSLAFAPLGRAIGRAAAACEFLDADGTSVSAVLNLDSDGLPLELDVWKVSFAPLQRWPDASQLVMRSTVNPG